MTVDKRPKRVPFHQAVKEGTVEQLAPENEQDPEVQAIESKGYTAVDARCIRCGETKKAALELLPIQHECGGFLLTPHFADGTPETLEE
jgi:hypothetical protein